MILENPRLILTTDEIESGNVVWRSPSNIALIKYWGKFGNQLPKNPSISFTLTNAFTETQLEYEPKTADDGRVSLDFYFENELNPVFGEKTLRFLESLTPVFPFLKQLKWTIRTVNSFPHSAGIASSASAMSALALCLCSLEDQFFGTLGAGDDYDKKASTIARLGSGSACRSIFGKAGAWGKTSEIDGSSDEFAVAAENYLHPIFQGFHDDILLVSRAEKSVSSRAGHALMDGNPFAEPRYQQARNRMQQLIPALKSGDLDVFGKIVEDEALTLHALMMASNPSYLLLKPGSLAIIERVRAFREETKLPVYFTIDAGPNIHLLYPENIFSDVRGGLIDDLKTFCEDGLTIADFVGDGPEEV
jgi:diphosphomevalonate decarboxylase